ncbi:putative transporter [Lineolata rhizophorae]|uniref:Putative transporter n=1 Tax=Lineolata rhizophorae TaxID=578093 RepID=A0A6A6PFH3_9PEZI|nr:putative transporter [Lineolata rhizophorae]
MKLRGVELRNPPRYVTASILCSMGGFLFGMDTGIIGPVTVMESYTSEFGSQAATIHGLIVSSILIPASISSFFAGRLADVLGRPKGIAIGALIFGIGAAMEGAAVQIAMFVVGRIIEGIGEGLYLGTLIVYICEISPPSQRGPLTTGPQLLITVGLVAGFFTCYGTGRMNSSMSWRAPYIVLASLSVLFANASFFGLPESPRWLSLRGRKAEAVYAWETLGVNPADREKAEDQYETPLVEDRNAIELRSRTSTDGRRHREPVKDKVSFFDVFKRDVRARTLLAVFMMGMQQMSGIDGVLYYAPLLFEQAGLASSKASFLASGVSAIVIFVVTVPALIWCDKWGRRRSTIYGGLGISATMFLIGGLYAGKAVHAAYGAGRWVVIVSIYVYTVIFSLSWAIGIRIYSAEIQPQRTRASATSLAHGSNWAANFLVALSTPILLANSSSGAYFLFGGCTLVTAVVCWVFMPETQGRSLDEIEEAFRSRMSESKGMFKAIRKVLARAPVTAEA